GLSATGSVSHSSVIDHYLGSLGSNGGPTETVPLLAVPSPATGSADPALGAIPASFVLPVAVNGISLACSIPDQRGDPRGQPCDIGAFALGAPTTPSLNSASPVDAGVSLAFTAPSVPAGSTITSYD